VKLLIVPAVIAAGGVWFNRQQRERERAIAEHRTQDEALQAYLDQMSDTLLPKTDQPSLYKARRGDSLSSVARARTLTMLPRLDGDRKARVVQFLHESGLIAVKRPIVDMSGAVLSEADLSWTDPIGADLRGASLSHAYLSEADLREATGWTEEPLRAASSLEGATMPDDQKYEEWLKSSGEENNGP
jgi:hypothetical protein